MPEALNYNGNVFLFTSAVELYKNGAMQGSIVYNNMLLVN